jgi:site-specific recombinase XerD
MASNIKTLKDVNLIDYFGQNKVKLKEKEHFPFICYSNGMPCYIANLYLLNLDNKNRSLHSIKQYASNINYLIEFCFKNKIDFLKLSEGIFIDFIYKLRSETDKNSPLKRLRNANTVNNIIRTNLDFLNFIGNFNGKPNFVFENIGAETNKKNLNLKDREYSVEINSWIHKSLEAPCPKKIRNPIGKNNIDKLYEAIVQKDSSKFLQQRRIIMLRLLESTGARAGEISLIKVKDVIEAIQNDGFMKMTTLKRKNKDTFRYVQIDMSDLNFIKGYINLYRKKIVKNTIGVEKDHGFLFINEHNGEKAFNTVISNDVSVLRKIAGIEEQTCAHMFRHRFITKQFINLIKQYKYENQDDFRKALLDTNTLKQKIQQMTGHKNLSSLDTYIDLAFNEVFNSKSVLNKVAVANSYESFDSQLKILTLQLVNGIISPSEFEIKQNELINNREISIKLKENDNEK